MEKFEVLEWKNGDGLIRFITRTENDHRPNVFG